jgi:hypothetical protein
MKKRRAERRARSDEWDGRAAMIWQSYFNKTGNPYYAWVAIRLATEDHHTYRLADWLMEYLHECAVRMQSSKAKTARDLGRTLPWVLGFPSRPGPARILDPEPEEEQRFNFALAFAALLQQGEEVPAARQDAYNLVFDGADVDDRTLQRWLLKFFGLKRQPPTIEEWKRVAGARFGGLAQVTHDELVELAKRDFELGKRDKI